MTARLGTRTIALVVLALFLVVLLVAGPAGCRKLRSLGAQNKVTQGQLGASHNSAADAIATTGNTAAGERASEEMTRANDKEIRNAPGANDPVNPAARDAGLRSLCRRPAYRDSERCRLLQPPAG